MGWLLDYGVVSKLNFSYKDKPHNIEIVRFMNEEIANIGVRVMERTIERLIRKASADPPREPMLHRWFLDNDYGAVIGHGVVTGHYRLHDGMKIHTSPVNGIEIDSESGDAIILTRNTTYRCPLNSILFYCQNEYPGLLYDYEELKEKYSKVKDPEIEHGKVLLVLSDYDNLFVHSLCVKDENGDLLPYTDYDIDDEIDRDTCLVQTEDKKVDIRYFPNHDRIEFYLCNTDGMPLYVENVGSRPLFLRCEGRDLRLDPGERELLIEENASKDNNSDEASDPAGIIE